jgi:hypothetical protein
MDFDIADSLSGHLCERFQQFAPVLLLRVEEAVSRTVARGISRCSICDTGPDLLPTSHTAKSHLHGNLLTKWLVMIRDGNPKPPGFGPAYKASCSITEVPGKP